MPLAAYQILCKAPPQPTRITAYGGTTLDVCGKTHQVVTYKGTTKQFEFILVRENVQTLLGLPSIRALGLLHETCEVTDQSTHPVALAYSNFGGPRTTTGEHYIILRHDAQPVIQSARRVPFKYRHRLQKQLQEMVEDSIITPVTEATDRVSPIVLVTKPGTDKLRICIDPGELNKAIHREHYQIKTPEEIFGSLSGTKYFTTLDATSGFLQITLDPERSYLTTFAAPFGRYRYLRLPFAICSAPEVFHRTVTKAFSDIPGIFIYVDDILVTGSTKAEHDKRLELVFQRCKALNLRLNKQKCHFCQTELRYLGRLLTADGIRPDPQKVEAVQNFPTPSSTLEAAKLLGLVTYLSKFCPDLATIVQPIRQLTHKDISWTWDSVHDETLRGIKNVVSEAPTLALLLIGLGYGERI